MGRKVNQAIIYWKLAREGERAIIELVKRRSIQLTMIDNPRREELKLSDYQNY